MLPFLAFKRNENKVAPFQSGKVKHELRVTSSNPRVTSSNPRVISSNLRVKILKARVRKSKARIETIKPRVNKTAIKPQ